MYQRMLAEKDKRLQELEQMAQQRQQPRRDEEDEEDDDPYVDKKKINKKRNQIFNELLKLH